MTNKQTQESLESDFPENEFQKTNMALSLKRRRKSSQLYEDRTEK
jgi:hypothetical protein